MEQIVKLLDLTGCVRVLYRIYRRISFKLQVLCQKTMEYKLSVEMLQAYIFYSKPVSKNCRFLRPEWNISLKFTDLSGVGV